MLICLYVTNEQPVYNNTCVAWVYILGCDFMPLKCFLDYDKISSQKKRSSVFENPENRSWKLNSMSKVSDLGYEYLIPAFYFLYVLSPLHKVQHLWQSLRCLADC